MSLTEKNSQNNDTTQSVHVKNPVQIFWLAMVFLVVVGGAMFFIDKNTNDLRMGKARPDTSEGVASRIQPVAQFALNIVEGDRPLKTGKEVYDATCTTCHATGVAGAPKFGDKAAWAPYIETGYETMLQVALNGKGAMPAKGGNTALDDLEVERAMVYMANEAGAGFPEPKGGEEGAAATKTAAATDKAEPAPAAEKADAAPTAEKAEEKVVAAAAPAAKSEGGIPAASADELATGKGLYDAACFVCHGSGVAGAPKFGDKAAWAPYIETGLDAMLQVAISGKGAMPPRGTAMNASDEELRAAILYMVEQVR
ncbi:MAG TPA: cytochrome c5 family protein [Alcaligenaceae bacterium]|nr:cytochrome c5 family protein [Alcaligenaceae bacterium]